MIKIVTIIGARPQFIKAAVVSRAFSNVPTFEEVIVHTGQHYDENMSSSFFEELDIPKPKYNLHINQGTHGMQTAAMIVSIEKVILDKKPSAVLVYGDTNSTVAGAIAGNKLHIPVIHVEAGLRSFDKDMPEEVNRIVTDHCSSIFFCPSKTAIRNLHKEGITKNVFDVGDVMYDSILFFSEAAERKSQILKSLVLRPKSYVLLTIHRASNTDSTQNLISLLDGFVKSNEIVVFPIHPRTKKKMEEMSLLEKYQHKNILFIQPVGYLDMISLEKNAKIIATDSGGVQKEAYFLRVPCITLRDTTEWVETVEVGCNVLVNADTEKIVYSLKNQPTCCFERFLYGDGNASQKIVALLDNIYK